MEISIEHNPGKIIKAAQAILDRYVIFLKTNEYEAFGSESVGANLGQFIDEPKSQDTYNEIRKRILNKTESNFPEVSVQRIAFRDNPGKTIQIDVDILIIPTGDQVRAIVGG